MYWSVRSKKVDTKGKVLFFLKTRKMEASQHAALFQQDIDPIDLHGDNSNIWGPKIDRMRISEYKIMPDIRKSICTIQNEVLFTPDDGVSDFI